MQRIIQATTDEFHAVDSADPRFFIRARVTRSGLWFRLCTRDLLSNDRSTIPAAEFFDAMMLALEPGDPPFYAVIGDWKATEPLFVSNLFLFNREVQNGRTMEEAASNTPTGRLAQRWGYCDIDFVVTQPKNVSQNFTRVLVRFVNPSK